MIPCLDDAFNREYVKQMGFELFRKTLNNNSFDGMFAGNCELTESLVSLACEKNFPIMCAWCFRIQEAPEGASGFRALELDDSGSENWVEPHSNEAFRIGVFLRLFRYFGDERYLDAAKRCADALLDPVYGLYLGPEPYGIGLLRSGSGPDGVCRTVDTLYVPPAFLELAETTGDTRYSDAAFLAGEALLRMVAENGTLYEGFLPKTASSPSVEKNSSVLCSSCSRYKIESSVGYGVHTFASLFRKTSDPRFREAMDALLAAIESFQYEDGSFPDHFINSKGSVAFPYWHCRNEFMCMLLDGCTTTLGWMTENPGLRKILELLADFLLAQHRRFWNIPGGCLDGIPPTTALSRSATGDAASGLFRLGMLLGKTEFVACAERILIEVLSSIIVAPGKPDFNGAFPVWTALGSGRAKPILSGAHHFRAVAGILDYLEWKGSIR